MYISSFGVLKRSTRMILYPEGSSKIVSKPHVSRKEESVGRNHVSVDFQIRIRERRKPVALRDAIGTGPS